MEDLVLVGHPINMALNLLPICLLFHATFALVYLPIIIFSFVAGDVFDGAMALLAIVGLGVFASL